MAALAGIRRCYAVKCQSSYERGACWLGMGLGFLLGCVKHAGVLLRRSRGTAGAGWRCGAATGGRRAMDHDSPGRKSAHIAANPACCGHAQVL